MKKQFIGKNKVFSREELKAIRGGTDDTTYYEGMECGRDGRVCSSDSDCQPLACSACTPYWTGGVNQWGHPIHTLRCT